MLRSIGRLAAELLVAVLVDLTTSEARPQCKQQNNDISFSEVVISSGCDRSNSQSELASATKHADVSFSMKIVEIAGFARFTSISHAGQSLAVDANVRSHIARI